MPYSYSARALQFLEVHNGYIDRIHVFLSSWRDLLRVESPILSRK